MSNELTDVRCPCGAEFQADSYDAGFIAGSGMCQNCDAALPPKDICTCPSGDGSLRWPCPAHPAEQAGGDERAAFELFVRKHCGMPEHIAVNWDAKFTNDAWEGWQARAALAQPSPMRCLACGGYHGNSGLPCPNMRVTAQAQPSPAGVQLSASRERRIYIAGPMTGYKDCNFPAFNAQAEALRGLGYHVENPADHGVVDGAEWQDYLRYDISRLSTCEAIFLLPGWSKSKGAALEVYIAKALGMTFIHHADAEREQPSPVQPEEAPVIGCLCGMPMTEGHHSPDGCSSLEEFAPHLSAQAQAKQAERPEVVARVVHSNPVVLGQCGPLNANDELMTVAQHAASVARWAEMFNRVEQERDSALAEVERLTRDRDDCLKARLHYATQLGEALARVAELYKQEPVATIAKVPGEDWNGLHFYRDLQGMQPGTKLYAAPVAQAQHSVPGDIMRDAQRYRWLRDQQFYFSFSTENSDAGISSCTAGMSSRFKNLSWVDAAIDSAIAAAPGKEGV